MEMGDITWRGFVLFAMIAAVAFQGVRITGQLERQCTALRERVQHLEEKLQNAKWSDDTDWLEEDE